MMMMMTMFGDLSIFGLARSTVRIDPNQYSKLDRSSEI